VLNANYQLTITNYQKKAVMSSSICANCCCPIDANRSGVANGDYCYVCDAMRTAVAESRYLRHIHEAEDHERGAARKRMGLDSD